MEKRLEDGRPIKDRPYMKTRRDCYTNQPKLFEVELYLLNDKPINDNENAAWEIIKGVYYNILFDDPHWHFFYEDKYNLIRCSQEFYDKVIEYLDECGVTYIEKGEWKDASGIVDKYIVIYGPLFHQFSMMAIEEYHSSEIGHIFDRVAHCFLNHQYLTLKNYRNNLPVPEVWEPKIIHENAMYRSYYIGCCAGINEYDEWFQRQKTRAEIVDGKKGEEKNIGRIRKFLKKLLRL